MNIYQKLCVAVIFAFSVWVAEYRLLALLVNIVIVSLMMIGGHRRKN